MITLQFATSNSAAGRVVRWFTWSEFSHVDFVLDDGSLLGALPDGGVQIRKAGKKNWTCTAQFVADAPQSVLDFAKAQIGKPYDRTAILGLALRRDWREDDSWFCSELVAAAFESAGVPLLHEVHKNRITPRDLLLSPLLTPAYLS